jgi:selenocysteine lyase/cysteine desulfurase
MGKGIDNIAAHDADLVDRLIEGLATQGYHVLSPRSGPERSTLVLASHRDASRNVAVHRALRDRHVEIAFRRGNLRFSPHIYNTEEDVDRALDALAL